MKCKIFSATARLVKAFGNWNEIDELTFHNR